jgi:hypothetical protein
LPHIPQRHDIARRFDRRCQGNESVEVVNCKITLRAADSRNRRHRGQVTGIAASKQLKVIQLLSASISWSGQDISSLRFCTDVCSGYNPGQQPNVSWNA